MQDRVSLLFFDMNSFFASVAQAEEPELMARPVGVLTTDAPNATCIASSIEAKRRGVKMGTRREEAMQLCPGIVFRAVKHDICVGYHHRIRQAASAIVQIEAAHSIDEFSCLLTGREQELDRARATARALQARIKAEVSPAMNCSVGLAPNRLLGKIASGLEKPGGIHWLLPHVMPQKIAHLKPSDLSGISRRMSARLEAAGIRDIPALYALAPKQARALWGSVTGERFLRELQGEWVDHPETHRSQIGHGQVLTEANRSPEGARLVARRLMVKAAARLRREGMFARSLSVSVKCASRGRLDKFGEIKATQDSFFLLEVFDRYWADLGPGRPLSVQVALGGLQTEAEHIPDLFEERPAGGQTEREKLCALIDRLNQRFGQDTIRFGELPKHRVPYTGAKIVFGRIPEMADFVE